MPQLKQESRCFRKSRDAAGVLFALKFSGVATQHPTVTWPTALDLLPPNSTLRSDAALCQMTLALAFSCGYNLTSLVTTVWRVASWSTAYS